MSLTRNRLKLRWSARSGEGKIVHSRCPNDRLPIDAVGVTVAGDCNRSNDPATPEISMTEIVSLPLAGYRFLRGQSHPFSAGVACLNGNVLTRVRFRAPLPLAEGLARASSFIQAQGRPLSALAACELRSPAPMSVADFAAFNRHYVDLLRRNGFPAEVPFPMARSNVAPIYEPPATNTLFAFTYAAAAAADAQPGRDFLISGRAELVDEPRSVVAEGDPSASGTE